MNPGAHRHLPRLADEAYHGRQFVHWTMTITDRLTGWLKPDFHSTFLEILRQSADRYDVVLPAYCLMPDHFHLLAAGISTRSDQLRWSRAIRRSINEALLPFRLQKQAYDHILRPAETGPDAFTALALYICENPVRAGLAVSRKDWPYVGSVVPTLPELDPRHEEFRDRWWAYWNALES